ncbi:histone H1-III-like [Saccoglossus kowalevskii]|uniref:Late histone H1-like n=1 Tax=Saccoglossus kowalevskii TaxID=10224 RepID=A0ABM0N110_SACKO|nr:PREDICTED: late histone H1-like [Saccoglossus kowalevskii]
MSDAAPAPQKKATKPKKPRAPAAHPKTIDMVVAAITNLKDRKGSSLQAIKKYVGANYKVDLDKITPFIRRALKSGVTDGKFVQIKGTGASGSFKLKAKVKAEKKAKKPKTPKKPKAKKPKAATKKPKAKKPKGKTPKKAKKSPAKKPKAAKKPAKKAPAKKAKKPAKKAAPKKK